MKPSTRRRLWLLGPGRVDQIQKAQSESQEKVAGTVPRFRSRRTVGLLSYLVAERRPIAREFLSSLFWPNETMSKGRANLSRELHNMARILPDCWDLDRQMVAFAPSDSTAVDLYTLLELEEQERWAEAANLLGGEFLEGLYLDDSPEFENWLLAERERWRGRAETILERIINGYIRRGRYTDALTQARRLLQLAPWDEDTHRRIMRLLAWTGQRGAALRQFDSCKRTLREELGVEPDSETIALYRQIQAGGLDLPPQLPAFLTAEKARHEFKRPPFVGRESELAQLDIFLGEALAGQGRVIFVTGGPGQGKTALLNAFAWRAMEMHPNLLVASGKCSDYSGLGDPFLPFRDVMAMLTGDVEGRWDTGAITREHAQRLWAALPLVVQVLLDYGPQLIDVLTPGFRLYSRAMVVEGADAPWLPHLREHIKHHKPRSQDVEQSYLFQQCTDILRTVAQKRPLLLILDDIQWADAASINLLFHLGRWLADADSRILIACAYRPEEVALRRLSTSSGQTERHPLAKVLSEFRLTFDDVWVHLGQAKEKEARLFADALVDIDHNRLGESFRSTLFERTRDHPLFTIELLHAMRERGDLLRHEDGALIEGPTLDWEVLPKRVEAVIEERINQLNPQLQELLKVASVEGEVFTAQVVAEVQNLSERSTLHQLSHDLEQRHRLVREQEDVYTGQRWMSRYRFGHVLYRDYIYRQLCQGERRLLHGDVGAALEKLYEGQLDELVVQLAHHFRHAEDYDSAFHYATQAAERAARLYESREAVTHYTYAIQLAERVSPDVVSLARLHRGRGLASERLGRFDQAHLDHTVTLQMARAAQENQVEWRALLDLGRLWASRNYDQARDYFEAALELARRTGEPVFLGDSLNWMGNWYSNDDNLSRAVTFHQEALAIFEDFGNQQELANTLDLLGLANLLGGNLAASVQYYDRAVALFQELDDRPRLASSLTGRATNVSALAWTVSVPAIPAPDAIRDFTEALRIAGEIGSVADQAWAHYSLGMLHMVKGHFGHALKDMQNSLRIASEARHREYVVGAQFAMGILYAQLFAPDRASVYLEQALALACELCSQTWSLNVSGALAQVYLMQNDAEAALICLEEVLSPQTPMDTLAKRYCWAQLAAVSFAQGNPTLALDITEHLIASTPGVSPERVVTYLWKLKGESLAALGHMEEACCLMRAAMENACATEEEFLLWRVHASLGQLYHVMDCQTDARQEFSAARKYIQHLADTIPDRHLKNNFLQHAQALTTTEGVLTD